MIDLSIMATHRIAAQINNRMQSEYHSSYIMLTPASGYSDLKEVYSIAESLEHHLSVLTHRDLIKSTRIRITTEVLYRELKPFFSIH